MRPSWSPVGFHYLTIYSSNFLWFIQVNEPFQQKQLQHNWVGWLFLYKWSWLSSNKRSQGKKSSHDLFLRFSYKGPRCRNDLQHTVFLLTGFQSRWYNVVYCSFFIWNETQGKWQIHCLSKGQICKVSNLCFLFMTLAICSSMIELGKTNTTTFL